MNTYYYLYSPGLGRGTNVKYSQSGALILYAKKESAERALAYALRHKYNPALREVAKTLEIREVTL